jgi:hypothetical protein
MFLNQFAGKFCCHLKGDRFIYEYIASHLTNEERLEEVPKFAKQSRLISMQATSVNFRLQMSCGQHEPIDEIGFYDEDADSVVRWAIDEFGHVFLKGYIFRSIH